MNPTDQPLDQQLAALPKTIEPPRDLWPAIEAAIRPAHRPGWPLALAASVVMVTVGSLYSWKLLHGSRSGLPGLPGSSAVTAALNLHASACGVARRCPARTAVSRAPATASARYSRKD